MTTLAIRGGRVIDPANGDDTVADLLISDGHIAEAGANAGKDASESVDARGLIV